MSILPSHSAQRDLADKRRDAPSREEDNVRVDRAAILELEAGLREPFNDAVVLQLDLPVDDQPRRADVQVVSSSTPPAHRRVSGAVRSEMRAEADLVQTLEEFPVAT